MVIDRNARLPAIKGRLYVNGFGQSFLTDGKEQRSSIKLPVFVIKDKGQLSLDNIEIQTLSNEQAKLIDNSGTLKISNVSFRDFRGRCEILGGFGPGLRTSTCAPLIANRGDLTLENTVFENISVSIIEDQPFFILNSIILNSTSGSVLLEQVIIDNENSTSHTTDQLSSTVIPAIHLSGGTMKVINSTFTGKRAGITVNPQANLQITNTILNFEQDNCILQPNSEIKSLGGNTSDDTTCPFNSSGDITTARTDSFVQLTGTLSSKHVSVNVPEKRVRLRLLAISEA